MRCKRWVALRRENFSRMKNYQGHDLLSNLFDDCKRYNSLSDDIAFACALHVVATVAQRRFQIPVGSTSLYQIFVVPMGAGKEGYRRWIEAYLRAVKPDLCGTRYRSDQALKMGLSKGASRALVIDEIADSMIGAYDPKRSDPMAQDLITLQNELYNALPRLDASEKLSLRIEGSERPRLSIVGFTTHSQFDALMRLPAFVGNGAFSRYQVYVHEGDEYEAWDDERANVIRPDPAIVEKLLRLSQGFMAMDPDEDSVTEVTMDKGALWKLQMYAQEARGTALLVEPQNRGMHRRIRELTARKMAGIRALACGRTVIMPGDAQFGIHMGDEAWTRSSAVLGDAGVSEVAKVQQDILAAFWRRHNATHAPVYISDVLKSKRVWSKDGGALFHQAITLLLRTGRLHAIGAKLGQLVPPPDAPEQPGSFEALGDGAAQDGLH